MAMLEHRPTGQRQRLDHAPLMPTACLTGQPNANQQQFEFPIPGWCAGPSHAVHLIVGVGVCVWRDSPVVGGQSGCAACACASVRVRASADDSGVKWATGRCGMCIWHGKVLTKCVHRDREREGERLAAGSFPSL